eukprot:1387513-Amorphochlora_amoeboformis.AAC.1
MALVCHTPLPVTADRVLPDEMISRNLSRLQVDCVTWRDVTLVCHGPRPVPESPAISSNLQQSPAIPSEILEYCTTIFRLGYLYAYINYT